MNCLDCAQQGRESAALAVCTQCGAAVCAAHARVGEQALTCTKPIARTVAVSPSPRRVLCARCAQAFEAREACCPSYLGA